MGLRIAALIAIVGTMVACTPEATGTPPSTHGGSVPAEPISIPAPSWRAVLIAGENNSPAFDNGIDALRAKLAARGVRDMYVLTSDPDRNPSARVASRENISSGLRSGSGEACLVFVTSHGLEKGVALKAANGLLEPSALNTALDAGCSARPTVVIVSACHSGVFLTRAMRQPNRIVLTASASDRVSFGCGADDQFTYYDQCLLQQFDGASTWAGLAQATQSCVAGLEQKMGIDRPSQPQVFIGASVAGLRLPGR